MTKYTVTFNGQTFTRKSERTYTHLVLATSNLEHAISSVHERANSNTFLRDYQYYCREADETTRKYSHSEKETALFKEIAAKALEQHRQDVIAKDLATIEAHRLAGDFEKFNVVGWCGREDLAEKSASSARAKPWNDKVIVVPVTAA